MSQLRLGKSSVRTHMLVTKEEADIPNVALFIAIR